MRTHLRESMLALLLIGILATGCDTGTKKASENSITFDSISVEKTYHLLDNPDNPNCNLEIYRWNMIVSRGSPRYFRD